MTYLIGVDGGGTSTIAVVADAEGRILSRGEGGPSNFQAVGLPVAVEAIRTAVGAALVGAPGAALPVDAICLGLAGVDTARQQELVSQEMMELGIARRVRVVNDAEIALLGALGDERGVVVVAGTGSAAFGGDGKGRTTRVGGWGWILGDEGSAFDIGREGLRATVRALDGRGLETKLAENLMSAWSAVDRAALETELRERLWNRYDVAQQAEWVSTTAAAGDMVARGILREAGNRLAEMAVAAVERLGLTGDIPVTYSGGVFAAGDLILDAFTVHLRRCAPKARLVDPLGEPTLGAVTMARRLLESSTRQPPAVRAGG